MSEPGSVILCPRSFRCSHAQLPTGHYYCPLDSRGPSATAQQKIMVGMVGFQLCVVLLCVLAWESSSLPLRINKVKSIARMTTTRLSIYQSSKWLPGSDFTAEQLTVVTWLSVPLVAYFLFNKPVERTSAFLDYIAELLRIGQSQKLLTDEFDDERKDPRR